MKLKATKKQIRGGYYKIVSIGYCDAQYLLNYESPFAYSAGNCGWACDYYDINGVLISTGYTPIKSKNVIDDYNLVREYDTKAREMTSKDEITHLLHEFINKVSKRDGAK